MGKVGYCSCVGSGNKSMGKVGYCSYVGSGNKRPLGMTKHGEGRIV